MPSAIDLQKTPARVFAVSRRLSNSDVISADRCGGGGNNRVYRIRTANASYALKCYESGGLDKCDRLGHEFDGLRFLNQVGIAELIPTALAVDREARCALYEWVEGAAVATYGVEDVAAVLKLLEALHHARAKEAAQALPLATEAVLCLADALAQIAFRLERLRSVTADEPELCAFLVCELQPELDRRVAEIASRDAGTELAMVARTLSPSDLGFHNALRRADGSLTFIDFEYFGWDDPTKLVADFLWHPAMRLSAAERGQFLEGVTRLYGADLDLTGRLALSFPFFGIRWILIVLNEFLPQIWERRLLSGKDGDWDAAKRCQLAKARSMLRELRAHGEGEFCP